MAFRAGRFPDHSSPVIIRQFGSSKDLDKGDRPLKIYSIYAPKEHPYGTVHKTQADAEAAHHHYE